MATDRKFVEADLVRLFREGHECGHFDKRLPQQAETDKVVCEMSFKFGRADIVIFHADGSATVVEAKDGARGYTHVMSGIGQASLYALQLAMSKGSVTSVRRCLLWSSTGDMWLDALIEEACLQASVMPLPWPSMSVLQAICADNADEFEAKRHGCSQEG